MTTRRFTTCSTDRSRRRLALFGIAMALAAAAFYGLPAKVSYHITEHYLFAGGSHRIRRSL